MGMTALSEKLEYRGWSRSNFGLSTGL